MHLCTSARLSARKFSPRVEALESRYCPVAPTISYLHSTVGAQSFMLTGHVTDEQPGGLTVQFTGVYTGTVQTASNGDFSITIQPNELGSIFAKVTDIEGLVSDSVQNVLTSAVPMVYDFVAIHLFDNVWSFSGRVSDEWAQGLTVRFGGLSSLQGKTATVASNGTFTLTVTLQPGEEGTATAQTTDWWQQDSNVASYLLHPSV